MHGWWRDNGTVPSRSLSEFELQEAITRRVCPLCACTANDADRVMRYLALEGHSEPEVLEQFRRAPFCATHARYAAGRTDMASPLGAMQGFALQAGVSCEAAAGSVDRRFGAGADVGCLACRSLRSVSDGFAFFLTRMLSGVAGSEIGSKVGAICQTHLQLLIPRLSDEQFRRVLLATCQRLDTPGDQHGALRLAVGEPPPLPAWPEPGEVTPRPPGDPVEDLLHDLADDRMCPVCREMGCILTHWASWLADRAATDDVADLLPTCREHAWAVVNAGPVHLASAVIANATRQHLGRLKLALGKLPVRAGTWGPQVWWRRLRDGPPYALARALLKRPLRCPLCERLDIAEVETLALLGALLRSDSNRAVFADGFGLCVRHAVRFDRVCHDDRVQVFVRGVQTAKLAVLHWELETWSRKMRGSGVRTRRGEKWRRRSPRCCGCRAGPRAGSNDAGRAAPGGRVHRADRNGQPVRRYDV